MIECFTGYNDTTLNNLIAKKVTFETFFKQANINSNAHLIKGVVCGYRIEEIDEQFKTYRNSRRLDKLIDELARGRKMEKILRK